GTPDGAQRLAAPAARGPARRVGTVRGRAAARPPGGGRTRPAGDRRDTAAAYPARRPAGGTRDAALVWPAGACVPAAPCPPRGRADSTVDGPGTATVRVPPVPAREAGPVARPGRRRGDPRARAGYRVRLAARVRARRRRPIHRLAGQRPAFRRRGACLAPRTRPARAVRAGHRSHVGGTGRRRTAPRRG